MKGNKIKTKVHLSGYTQGQHMWTSATRDIIEKMKRGTISTSRFDPSPRDCSEALSKAGRGSGADLSQVVGEERRREVWGEGR